MKHNLKNNLKTPVNIKHVLISIASFYSRESYAKFLKDLADWMTDESHMIEIHIHYRVNKPCPYASYRYLILFIVR